jgi:hypothetical protein
MHVLRFGHLPISALLKLGGIFARMDEHLGVNSALLDELFGSLLADFSPERRAAIAAFFAEVGKDRALLPQLTPEALDVFNASSRDRAGVRYGSVVTAAPPPGVLSALDAGLDPSAQATHAIYQALYRLASRVAADRVPALAASQRSALERGYGALPTPGANDGLVPTLSQVWGEVIHTARADHLDVVGHFADPDQEPPHFDWLTTGSGFDRDAFEHAWGAVLRFLSEF